MIQFKLKKTCKLLHWSSLFFEVHVLNRNQSTNQLNPEILRIVLKIPNRSF